MKRNRQQPLHPKIDLGDLRNDPNSFLSLRFDEVRFKPGYSVSAAKEHGLQDLHRVINRPTASLDPYHRTTEKRVRKRKQQSEV